MDFARYLYFTKRLTRLEYEELGADQRVWGIGDLGDLTDEGFAPEQLQDIKNLTNVRKLPFGEILEGSEIKNEVLAREGTDCLRTLVAEWVTEWYAWHLQNIEPVCNYSIVRKAGRCLYERQEEKKLVAKHIVGWRDHSNATIVQDGDTVVIPEGTSAAYVGLAIANKYVARAEDHTDDAKPEVVSSNLVLIREFQDNPAVAKGFKKFHVIGGLADRSGVHGAACKNQYEALIRDPGATAVFMSVNGFLPNEGPLGVDGEEDKVKERIIESSLEVNDVGVRELVFLLDYTKQLPSRRQYYGRPLFPPDRWQSILEEHKQRIRFITVPPPALRSALAFQQGRDLVNRDLEKVNGPKPFTNIDSEYDAVAKALHDLAGGEVVNEEYHSRFHEVHDAVTDRALFAFTLDHGQDSFSEQSFRAALSKLISEDIADFKIRVTERGGKAVVIVVGSPDMPERIDSLCEFKNVNVDGFAEATNTITMEVTLGGRQRTLVLDRLPARH